jgi:hypothetical protein
MKKDILFKEAEDNNEEAQVELALAPCVST